MKNSKTMQQRQTERYQRQSGIISRVCPSDCSSPHTRLISLDLKIPSLVRRAIVASPAIPLTAKRGTVLAGVPRSSDGVPWRRSLAAFLGVIAGNRWSGKLRIEQSEAIVNIAKSLQSSGK
jgi:hypothetical protein